MTHTRHTQTAGGVVLRSDGNIILTSQHGRSWSLPKGHIEEGEDAQTAALREIEEETGITELVFIEKLGTYQRCRIGENGEDDTSEIKTITIFLYHTKQRKLQPSDPDNPEAIWLTTEKAIERLTHPKDKEFLKSVLERIR